MNQYLAMVKYTCPICEKEFTSPRPRSTKLKLINTDQDLRPYHIGVDTVLYETVVCSHCGYASINKTFNVVKSDCIENILNYLKSVNFQHLCNDNYNIDTAIDRYFLAIKILELKKAKASEYSYLYLRLSWLYRVLENNPNATKNEYLALKKALEYGEIAYNEESMPFLDIDSNVFVYLLAEMSRRVGQYDKAYKYISSVLLDKNISPRLRNRAEDTKELIKKAKAS